MTSQSSRLVIMIVFGCFIAYRILFPADSEDQISELLLTLSIDLFSAVVLLALLHLLQNLNQLRLYFQTRILLRNQEVRLSIAYLFRINVNGQYLLVKSRTRNYYQPVGGAFKTLPGSEKTFEKLGVKPDRLVETECGIAKGDLRVYVKGSNLIEFLEWFHSKEDRETSPWREFCEELISSRILPWEPFRYIDYKFKGLVKSPIIDLESGGKGMFLFEIYDLVTNDKQRSILEQLLNEGNKPEYIWADNYLIQRLGHDGRAKEQLQEIAPHTKYAQNLKWSNR